MTRAQLKTLGWLIFVLFVLPIIGAAILLGVEVRTLTDKIPDNHITAVLRKSMEQAPGVVVLLAMLWTACIVAAVFGVSAHAWWS